MLGVAAEDKGKAMRELEGNWVRIWMGAGPIRCRIWTHYVMEGVGLLGQFSARRILLFIVLLILYCCKTCSVVVGATCRAGLSTPQSKNRCREKGGGRWEKPLFVCSELRVGCWVKDENLASQSATQSVSQPGRKVVAHAATRRSN